VSCTVPSEYLDGNGDAYLVANVRWIYANSGGVSESNEQEIRLWATSASAQGGKYFTSSLITMPVGADYVILLFPGSRANPFEVGSAEGVYQGGGNILIKF